MHGELWWWISHCEGVLVLVRMPVLKSVTAFIYARIFSHYVFTLEGMGKSSHTHARKRTYTDVFINTRQASMHSFRYCTKCKCARTKRLWPVSACLQQLVNTKNNIQNAYTLTYSRTNKFCSWKEEFHVHICQWGNASTFTKHTNHTAIFATFCTCKRASTQANMWDIHQTCAARA